LGQAGRGPARYGMAGQAGHVEARPVQARQAWARHGRRGAAWQGPAGLGLARHGKAEGLRLSRILPLL
jgi:hypothetical protein